MNIDKLSEIYDVLILHHHFLDHNRDYEFFIEMFSGRYSLVFCHTYQLEYKVTLESDTMLKSVDNKCLDHKACIADKDFDGYIWGSNYVNAYPGFSVNNKSKKAELWSAKLGIKMHEILLETEVYAIKFFANDYQLVKKNNKSKLINHLIYKFD
jgi:hypothetical protein